MGGATSVMPVIRDAFSQQAADTTQRADTIDWTVRCDWLQIARSRLILYTNNIMHADGGCIRCKLVQVLQEFLQFCRSCDLGFRGTNVRGIWG